MHYLLFYEKATDFALRQLPHQAAHLTYVQAAVQHGLVLLGGSLNDPTDGAAVLLLEASSRAEVEAYAAGDPYVIHGIVSRWWVRGWDTIVGNNAARPMT